MKNIHTLAILFSHILITTAAFAEVEPKIEAYRAPFHVGQNVMACGQVAETKTIGNGTYLNLDKSYPSQSLTLVIWSSDLNKFESKFGYLQNLDKGRVCGRGKITDYKGNLQIVLRNENNLRLMH